LPTRTPHGELRALQTRYPINFVVKHPNRLVFYAGRRALKRLKPAITSSRKNWNSMFPGRRHPCEVAASRKQKMRFGGADRDRTGDPLLAKQVLSQLSYSPTRPPRKAKIAFWGPRCASAAKMVGLGRVELPTSPLSGVRSNQLSYRPNGWPATPPSKYPAALTKPHSIKGFRGQG
jgi:hypothetical protein